MASRLLAAWRRVNFPAWTAPLALLLAVCLCYALRLPRLGFYWDDWPYLYLYQAGGYPALTVSLGLDRPVLSWLYAGTLSLLGSSPLAWQLFAVMMRWVLVCAFWLALRQAWPGRGEAALWPALLFAVYPGFSQQWVSVVWGNAYVLYAALFFSIALTTWAARQASRQALWLSLLPGLALSAFAMFSTEYFYGLELLRPVLVWLGLASAGLSRGRRAARTALAWIPYLGLMASFAAWRAFFQPSAHAGLFFFNDLRAAPLTALLDLAARVAKDGFLAMFAAWGQALAYEPLVSALGLEIAFFALGTAGLFWLFLSRGNGNEDWAAQGMLVGLFAFLAAGWPVWLARLPLSLAFPWDRYTLSLSAGASLFAAGLIAWAGRGPGGRALLLAVLIGASAGFHNARAAQFNRDWNAARDMLWQLAWRAPAIQPGTALLADGTGLSYFEDDSLSGPLNLLYPAGGPAADGSITMDVLLMNIPERLKGLHYLAPASPIFKRFGAASFQGSTSQAVVLVTAPGTCLQVLDPRRDAARADLPEYARRALSLSRPELLLPAAADPAALPVEFFGPEPEHKWCYYYEKAALAAQQDDWDTVNVLRQEAAGLGYKPLQASEYLIFVSGALRTYNWPDARQLSQTARDLSAATLPALCAAWDEAAAWGGESEIYRAGRAEFTCTEP